MTLCFLQSCALWSNCSKSPTVRMPHGETAVMATHRCLSRRRPGCFHCRALHQRQSGARQGTLYRGMSVAISLTRVRAGGGQSYQEGKSPGFPTSSFTDTQLTPGCTLSARQVNVVTSGFHLCFSLSSLRLVHTFLHRHLHRGTFFVLRFNVRNRVEESYDASPLRITITCLWRHRASLISSPRRLWLRVGQ
jgi:hypothetical protein